MVQNTRQLGAKGLFRFRAYSVKGAERMTVASALDRTGASAVRNVIMRIITIREGPQRNCYRHRSVRYFQRGNSQFRGL